MAGRAPHTSSTLHKKAGCAVVPLEMTIANPKVKLIEHPLAAVKLSILRAKTTAPEEFRRNMQEIAMLLFCEAGRAWTTRAIAILERDSYTSVIDQNLRKALGQVRSMTLCRARLPIRSRSAGSTTNARMARVKSSTSCDLVMRPFSLFSTNSVGPPASETITGTPDACASMMTLPNVSVVLGKAKRSAEAY